MIFYTIYTSTPRIPMTKELLDQITATAIRNNKQKNITGMLLGIEGKYLQYLEGTEKNVVELFDKIKLDGRHHQVNQWVKGFTDKRIFSDWSMGSWMLNNEELMRLGSLKDLQSFLKSPESSSTPSGRFIQMMHDLLKTWIDHEPERVMRLKE